MWANPQFSALFALIKKSLTEKFIFFVQWNIFILKLLLHRKLLLYLERKLSLHDQLGKGPANIYFFKINNKNNRKRNEIYPKLTTKKLLPSELILNIFHAFLQCLRCYSEQLCWEVKSLKLISVAQRMNFFLKHFLSDLNKSRDNSKAVSWRSSIKKCPEKFCKIYRKTSAWKYLFDKVKKYRHKCFLVTFANNCSKTTFLLSTSGELVLKTASLFNYFLFSIVVLCVTVMLVSLTSATNKHLIILSTEI